MCKTNDSNSSNKSRPANASLTELCRQYEISRKTGYKWLRRCALEGVAGLARRSRKSLCRQLQQLLGGNFFAEPVVP